MRLPLLVLLLAPAALRAQVADEIVPVSGFELASDGARACRMDMCGSVPAPFSDAMLMAKDEWMLTVRVDRQRWLGTRDGHHALGTGEIIGQGFTMAPRDMDMTMTMLEAMVGLDDDSTLMVMLPYVQNTMLMSMDDGTRFHMHASGIGDLQIGTTTREWEGDGARLVFHAGLSAPTGSVNRKDDQPGAKNQTVDYVMEPGSGTWDLRPSVTWLDDETDWIYGAQLALIQRLGRNAQGWSGSNERDVSVWAVRKLDMDTSVSGRLTARLWGNIHGSDSSLDPTMSPTQDPNSQAGRRIDAALGLRSGEFVAEAGMPVYEVLDGPQLSLAWFASVGWQFSF